VPDTYCVLPLWGANINSVLSVVQVPGLVGADSCFFQADVLLSMSPWTVVLGKSMASLGRPGIVFTVGHLGRGGCCLGQWSLLFGLGGGWFLEAALGPGFQ
jgi:hypothetical protein